LLINYGEHNTSVLDAKLLKPFFGAFHNISGALRRLTR